MSRKAFLSSNAKFYFTSSIMHLFSLYLIFGTELGIDQKLKKRKFEFFEGQSKIDGENESALDVQTNLSSGKAS